ncbi:STM3941 family protein [Ralstonia sp. 25mfcol4.1]|uniref:STM3941 family protein n=1 Tax=Ralstonia sp. 25mfcol4.1 TaxID=1761899 RepID=UPI000675C7A9|nr:STM3941 family protein [Ralstonia sp. 25mfcol4.1]
MGSIVIYQSRGKLAVLLLGSILFVVLCIFLLAKHPVSMSAKSTIAVALGIPFFAACGLFMLFRLLWRRPAIIIDYEGINDQASAASIGFIPWKDISHAKVVVFGSRHRQKYLCVSLRNSNDYLAKCGPLARGLLRANAGMSGYIVNIPQAALSVGLEVALGI